MKLTQGQKIRIAVFHDLYPNVSHRDLADLFEVSRTSISGVIQTYSITDEKKRREFFAMRRDYLLEAAE